MPRRAIVLITLWALAAQSFAQEDVPLVEPTNRPAPAKIETANIFSFCRQDHSIAFVMATSKTLVHQFFPDRDSSPMPIEFDAEVRMLSCSPDGKTLAVMLDGEIHFANRALPESKRIVVPLSSELESPSELMWSADSNVLFAIRQESPGSATRIPVDRVQPDQEIVFSERVDHWIPNVNGDLLVAFTRQGVEIWRDGETENKIVKGRSEIVSGSPDGRFVAFMAGDKLQIWTLTPLGKGATISAYGAEFIQFSADGKQLLISEADDKAKCYTVSNDGELALGQEYEATSGCAWLSDDGKLGACFSYSETSRLMRVFRCDTKAEAVVPITTKSAGYGGYDPDIFPERYMLSKDGKRGLVVWPAGRIELFDIRSRLSDWGCRVPELAHVWLSGSGDKLLTIDKSGNLLIHDTKIGRVRRGIVSVESDSTARRDYGDTPFRFQILPDGRHCIVWCGAGLQEFAVMEMSTQKVVVRVKDSRTDDNDFKGWHASDDGSVICIVGDRVRLLRTGFQAPTLSKEENKGRFHLAMKVNGSREPVHGIFDTKSGQMRRTIQWEFVKSDSLQNWGHVSQDGQLCTLVARRLEGDGAGVEIRSTKSGKQQYAIPLGDAEVKRVDFTRDQMGMWVVTRQALMRLDFEAKTLTPFLTDAEVHKEPVEYNPKQPTPLPDSTFHTTQFESVAESDTGWIATGHRRGFVNIWSIKDQKRYAFLRCGTEVVKALVFSPDGKYLLSWCADRHQVQVTDVSSILPASPPAPRPEGKKELNLDF